ncbi:MAG: hypothetical protein KIS92_14290 [Planctomycetota bacterium]|nr:hypothetical protein [Planctomycetota bacterium]
MAYRHFQTGTVLRIGLAAGTLTMLAAAVTAPPLRIPMLALACMMGVLGVLFHGLDVAVDEGSVRLSLGIGLLRKDIPRAEIAEVRPVRNHWLMGWGIRYFGSGWMWNVSGLDAVELRFTNGRRFRIGTDDPQGLCDALRSKTA